MRRDLDRARGFYEAWWLAFREERHESGPLHLSYELRGLVLELYPASQRLPVESSTRLGFRVASIASAEARLRELGLHRAHSHRGRIRRRNPTHRRPASPRRRVA